MAPPSPATSSAWSTSSSSWLNRRSAFLAASILSISVLAGLLLVAFLSLSSSPIPFPPFLRPVGALVLYRLRDVCVFVLCTTTIAVFILSSLNRDQYAPETRKRTTKPAPLEHLYPPVASLFGDPGSGESEFLFFSSSASTPESSSCKHQRNPAFRADGKSDESGYGDSEIKAFVRSPASAERGVETRAFEDRVDGGARAEAALHRRNFSKDEGASPSRGMEKSTSSSTSERKLHRRSSSLDDRINYELAPHAAKKKEEAGNEAAARKEKPVQQEGEKKRPSRRVSFYIEEAREQKVNASVSSSALSAPSSHFASVGPPVHSSGAMSPNELINRQADAFIAKFKEQMRLQKLESFQRFRRKASP